MDFANESYVRLYPRKTVTNRLLGWEGRAVLHAMLGEFDRSGWFSCHGDVSESIVAVTDIPLDVARAGLARLIATRTWEVIDGRIWWPTFEDAQTCRKSDRLRQLDTRARKSSPGVTPCHPASPGVTPSLAQPSSAKPSEGDPAPQSVTGRKAVFHSLDGWEPSTELRSEALMQGIPREEFDRRIRELRNGPIAGARGTTDRDEYVRLQFPKWRTWRETDKAQRGARVLKGGTITGGVVSLEPSDKHRRFAAKHGIDLGAVLREMNDSGIVETLGLGRAREVLEQKLSQAARAAGNGKGLSP